MSISEPRVQEKCLAMLKKIVELNTEVSLLSTKQVTVKHVLSSSSVPTPDRSIADAEIVIRGADGKKMYFKKRRRPDVAWATGSSTVSEPRVLSALVVPHASAGLLSCRSEIRSEPPVKQKRIRTVLAKRLWPACQALRIARLDSRRVIVRAEEQHERDALVVTVYSPDSCRTVTLVVSFDALALVLPALLVWDHLQEVRYDGGLST